MTALQRHFSSLIVLGCLTLTVRAQELQTPATGFVFDPPTRSIRPIRGALGSATLGEPLVANLEAASISPSGARAIVTRHGVQFWVRLPKTDLIPLRELTAKNATVSWNAQGDVAVLVHPDSPALQVVTENQESINVASLPLPAGDVKAVALRSAAEIYLAVSRGPGPGIYRIDGQGRTVRLHSGEGISGLGLSPKGDLFAITADGAALVRIEDPAATAATFTYAVQAPANATQIAFSSDSAALFVPDGQQHQFRILAAADGQSLGEIAADLSPQLLQSLGPASRYVIGLRDAADSAVWVLETSQRSVLFIPGGK